MKQHISVEDLKKHSNEEQIKIATLFGQYGNCCNTGGETMNLGKLSERITIGKMIEILEKKVVSLDIRRPFEKWRIKFWHAGPSIEWEADELCDALWQAIKAVL